MPLGSSAIVTVIWSALHTASAAMPEEAADDGAVEEDVDGVAGGLEGYADDAVVLGDAGAEVAGGAVVVVVVATVGVAAGA